MTRRDLLLLILAFVITRAALVGAGVIALRYYPPNEGAEFTHLIDGGAALDLWYRWDAGFYATIATDGYDWLNTRQPADDMAFLPLYPLAIHLVSGLTPTGCLASPYLSTCATVGGVIVSNAALLIALLLLFDLARRRFGRSTAWRVALLLLVVADQHFPLRRLHRVAVSAALAAGLLAAGAGSLRLGGARGDLRLPDPLGRRGAGSGAAVVRVAASPHPRPLSHEAGEGRKPDRICYAHQRGTNFPSLKTARRIHQSLNPRTIPSRQASLLPSLKSGRGRGWG